MAAAAAVAQMQQQLAAAQQAAAIDLQQQQAHAAAQQVQIDALIAQLAAAPPAAAAVAAGVDPNAGIAAALLAALSTPQAPLPTPAPFLGGAAGLGAQKFLNAVEQYFEAANLVTDTTKLRRAGVLLQGSAALWWRGEQTKPADALDKVSTWAQFHAALLKRYQPVEVSTWARQELHKLIAMPRSASGPYFDRVLELMQQIPHMHAEDQIDLTRRGLPRAAREYIATKKFDTLADLIEKVQIWEQARIQLGVGAPEAGRSAPSYLPRGPRVNEIEFVMTNGWDDEPELCAASSSPPAAAPASATDLVLKQISAQLNAMNARFGGGGGKDKRKKTARAPRKGDTPGLPNELAQARIQAHLCIHCGQKGHMKRDCSNAADITTEVTAEQKVAKRNF